jgi:hypothetical protein
LITPRPQQELNHQLRQSTKQKAKDTNMKTTQSIASVLAIVLGAALHALPAAAATPVSCGPVVNGYLDGGASSLAVVGTSVTARNSFGFSTFTMEDGYQVETYPLHTAGSAARSVFKAMKTGSDAFSGYFHIVFPGRGNGDEDRSVLWVSRGGWFWLQSITWGGSWMQLQSVVCYAGPSGQLVVTGHIDNPGFGTDFWSFVMQRSDRI